MRFSQQLVSKQLSSGMRCHVVLHAGTDVSQELAAYSHKGKDERNNFM